MLPPIANNKFPQKSAYHTLALPAPIHLNASDKKSSATFKVDRRLLFYHYTQLCTYGVRHEILISVLSTDLAEIQARPL